MTMFNLKDSQDEWEIKKMLNSDWFMISKISISESILSVSESKLKSVDWNQFQHQFKSHSQSQKVISSNSCQ